MTIHRRRMLALGAATAVAMPLWTCRAWAQAYPARPVHVLVGFPPGGGADVLTRAACDWLQQRLGQPFVVENRPGAGTNLATEAVVRAAANGHTLLATTTSNLLNGALYPDLKYDFVRDIAPVACLSVQPLVLEVGRDVPARSVAELIAHAQALPGRLNFGHFGNGTISHLAAEAFRRQAGIDVAVVPYTGAPAMLVDLLAGRIHAAFDNIPTSIAHIRAGRLQALAVTTAVRAQALPDVPAIAERMPGFEAYAVAGLGAPRGTPPQIIDRLNAEVNAGLADARLKERLESLGATVLPGTPADFASLIARETEKWSRVVKTSGIKLS